MKKEENNSLVEDKVKITPNIPKTKVNSLSRSNVTNVMGNDLSKNTLAILSDALMGYRATNKELVKLYANKYSRKHISDRKLLSFMLNAIKFENVNYACDDSDFVSEYNEDVESVDVTDKYLTKIRKNNRWFYDLMLYLNDKYTERQLLNSEFFKTVKDKDLLKVFSKNTDIIDILSNNIKREYKNYRTKTTENAKKEIQQKQK